MSTMMDPQQQAALSRNPMLPQHPVTAALDSQYYAAEAILRQQTAQKYQDILQQLGYTDDQGNFIPGSVQVNAQRQSQDLQRSSDLAARGVTENSQRTGTLFSGRRESDTGEAEYPYQNQIAQLGIDTPLTLAGLHEQASGLVDQYTLQNNQLLADAATRASQNITQNGATAPGSPAPAAGIAQAGANAGSTVGALTGTPPIASAFGGQGAKNQADDPFHSTVQAIHNASLKALTNGSPNQGQVLRNLT